MTGHQDLAFVSAAILPVRESDWIDYALCGLYFDPDIWFPESQHGSNKRAKETEIALSICEDCPVRAECYADALERGERWGIWGGKDFYVPENKHAQLKEAS